MIIEMVKNRHIPVETNASDSTSCRKKPAQPILVVHLQIVLLSVSTDVKKLGFASECGEEYYCESSNKMTGCNGSVESRRQRKLSRAGDRRIPLELLNVRFPYKSSPHRCRQIDLVVYFRQDIANMN